MRTAGGYFLVRIFILLNARALRSPASFHSSDILSGRGEEREGIREEERGRGRGRGERGGGEKGRGERERRGGRGEEEERRNNRKLDILIVNMFTLDELQR